MRNVKGAWLALFAATSLVACGGGGGAATTVTGLTALGGAVIDGYINGAKVCIDVNSNLQCDASEPTTTSGASGAYSFTGLDFDATGYNVIAEVGTDAIDEDTGTNVAKPFSLAAPAAVAEVAVTPVTTLVAVELTSSTGGTFEEKLAAAKTAVAASTGIPAEHLEKDFVKEQLTEVHNVARATAAIIAEAQSAALATDDVKAVSGAELLALKKNLLKEAVVAAKQQVSENATAIKAAATTESLMAIATNLADTAATTVSGNVAQIVAGSALGESTIVDAKKVLAEGFVMAQDNDGYLSSGGSCSYRNSLLSVDYLKADMVNEDYADVRRLWDWGGAGEWQISCQNNPSYLLSSKGTWLLDSDGPPTKEDFLTYASFDQNCVKLALAGDADLNQTVCFTQLDVSNKTFAQAVPFACVSDEDKANNDCTAVMPTGSIAYNATFSYNQDTYHLWYWTDSNGANAARQYEGSLQDYISYLQQDDQWTWGSSNDTDSVRMKIASVTGAKGAVTGGKVMWVLNSDLEQDADAAIAAAETTDFVVKEVNGVQLMQFTSSALERKVGGAGTDSAYFFASVVASDTTEVGKLPGVYRGSVQLASISQQADFTNPYTPKFMSKTLADAALKASGVSAFPYTATTDTSTTDTSTTTSNPCSDATTFCAYSDSVGSDGVLPIAFASDYAPAQKAAGALNQAPNVYFSNVPAGANYLSIVMDDETEPCGADMKACVHAGVFDLPATLSGLTGKEPSEDMSGVTWGGLIGFDGEGYFNYGYEGPFPPSGTTHTYKITVYAHKSSWAAYGVAKDNATTGELDKTDSFGNAPVTRAQVAAERSADIVASSTLTFTFTAP